MTYDGSTSGEPYFWQTPDSNYREWHRQSDEGAPRDTCECCCEGTPEDELVHDAAFGGWACQSCRDEWWLAGTSARRNLNLGGEWTK